jgi:hypothetical protein
MYAFENLEVIVTVFISHIDKRGLKAGCFYGNRSTHQLLVPGVLHMRVSCVSKMKARTGLGVAARIYN